MHPAVRMYVQPIRATRRTHLYKEFLVQSQSILICWLFPARIRVVKFLNRKFPRASLGKNFSVETDALRNMESLWKALYDSWPKDWLCQTTNRTVFLEAYTRLDLVCSVL